MMSSHAPNDAAMRYDLKSLVWVKQPDYPWWPGIVIDSESVGLGPMPADSALCVMCYPTEAATAVFVHDPLDRNEVRPFHGLRGMAAANSEDTDHAVDDDDAALVRAGMADAQCAPAVREALAVFAQRHTSSASSTRATHAVHVLESHVDGHVDTSTKTSNAIPSVMDGGEDRDGAAMDAGSRGHDHKEAQAVADTAAHGRAVMEANETGTEEADLSELTTLVEQPDEDKSGRRSRRDEHRHRERRRRGAHSRHRRKGEAHDGGDGAEKSVSADEERDASEKDESRNSNKSSRSSSSSSSSSDGVFSRRRRRHHGSRRDRKRSRHTTSSRHSRPASHKRRQRDRAEGESTFLRQTQLDEYDTLNTQKHRRPSQRNSSSDRDSDTSSNAINSSSNRNGSSSSHTHKHRSNDTQPHAGDAAAGEEASQYFYQRCRAARHSVNDDTLNQSGARLLSAIAECLHTGCYDEHEDTLLALLRPLACCDVSLAQLRRTHIGLTIGQLVKGVFPHRVRALAQAILTYWFMHLPAPTRRGLIDETEVDHCSVVSTQSGRSGDSAPALLGTVGVHLYESFTEEEINDAPLSVDVTELCRAMEAALRECSEDHDTQVMVLSELTDPANSALRRAILQGKLAPEDVVRGAGQMRGLRRRRLSQGVLPRIVTSFGASGEAMESPTSPFSPASPVSDSSSFTSPTSYSMLGNVTTLYACPNCGAQEAYRTNYTVQAHDNFPEIFRCVKCHTSWNITGQ